MKPDAFEQIIKAKPIQLTWKGNRNCFVLHEKSVYNALGNGSVSWKRDDEKKAPYPLPTRFQLIFLPFDPHFVIRDGIVATVDQVAFIHFYFLLASTVEEYRQVLPEFAEWFSQVRDSNFIIVFDSTKAKENKSRGHIMEKLKSDVQNHSNKILEINVNKPAFCGAVLSTFTSALDKYSNNLSAITLTKRDEHDEPDFSVVSLINLEFSYCTFYWSLGLLESALEVMEEMVKVLNALLDESSSKVWLNKLRSPLNGYKSLILSESLNRSNLNESDSLLSIRSFLLSHQIFASIYVFEERKQKKLGDVATLGNLRNYFITLLARYGLQMVENAGNDWHRLKLREHRLLQDFIQIFWLEEILSFLGFIGDFFDSESSARFVIQIHQILIDAWEDVCSKKYSNTYVDWFDSINKVDDSLSPLIHTLRFLRPDEMYICYNETLKRGLNVMERHKWNVYYTQNKWKRVKLLYDLGKKDLFRREVMEFIESNSKTKMPVPWLLEVFKTLNGTCKGEMEKEIKVLRWLVLSQFIYNPTEENLKALRSLKPNEINLLRNFEWKYNTQFPFKIKLISRDLITSKVGSVFNFTIKILSHLPLDVGCESEAILCFLDADRTISANPCFKSRQEGSVLKIANVQKALPKSRYLELFSKTSSQLESKVTARLLTDPVLRPGINVLQFEAKCSTAGLYCLNEVNIMVTPHDVFSLSYQYEASLNDQLKPLLCHCSLDRPTVKICNDEKVLFAGIAQRLKIYVEFGSNASGDLKISLADGKSQVEFLDEDGKWTKDLVKRIENREKVTSKVTEIGFCAKIDRMNYSAEGKCNIMHKIKVEWLGNVFFFDLSFKSILSIKTMTSILEDRILFEMDVERCDSFEELLIVPFEAKIERMDVKEIEETRPNLLNPSLDPIPASATYRLIWQLPPNRDDQLHMDYSISLAYKIISSGDLMAITEDMAEIISSRDYLFQDTIGFTAPNVEFEVCTRILTERPQTVICRSDHPCDLAVTLRALSDNPQTVIISIEADPNHWSLVEKFKVVTMKGNGLGQCSFQIIPKATGFLPYPAVFVHRCNGTQSLMEKDPSTVDTILFGERVTHFNRSEAKQIHVLNGITSTDDSNSAKSTSSTGTKRSLRSQAKERLKMLFE
ncbi:unnamed protein product [Bursaphelenchus xylophilus]|uniref:(pine wood nematode) hypothetical protein n=1 Tax=Bursaphelenchus xylophilus TaxID=6326 RepID=A0A1I7RLA1_BURXY|nr:unnamed protein product [Bursaphelenchus xylophilus]CAG9083254.1 unnamed protein product [Bursaphelenchus xylophilus]